MLAYADVYCAVHGQYAGCFAAAPASAATCSTCSSNATSPCSNGPCSWGGGGGGEGAACSWRCCRSRRDCRRGAGGVTLWGGRGGERWALGQPTSTHHTHHTHHARAPSSCGERERNSELVLNRRELVFNSRELVHAGTRQVESQARDRRERRVAGMLTYADVC